MNLQSKIEKAIIKPRHSVNKSYEEITFLMAKELHISPSELMDLPIPLVLSLSDNLSKYFKQQKKAMSKKK